MKCCTKLETAKERSPIVFQCHPSNFKVTRDKTSPILTQIGRFQIIGRSQLSNPSDLPCSIGHLETNANEIWSEIKIFSFKEINLKCSLLNGGHFICFNLFHLSASTHWGRVTHICVSKLVIIGSDNGLSPDQRQAIIWTNDGKLGPYEQFQWNFNRNSRKCLSKCHLRNGVHSISPIMF